MTLRMSTPIAAFAIAACFVAPAALAQTAAKLVPAQSEIAFTFKQTGVPVEGKFKRFDAQIAFDPKQPAGGRVAFTIDLTSASLGAAEVEAELVKPEWFDTKKSANATFQSTSIKASGAGKFDVAGKLTIKGHAHDVVVPVALTQAGGTTTATGAFTIKRLDYKIGDGDWADTSMVADDVQVKFKLTLNGVGSM
ncbi:MAG: YceI family protein [Proteobacteria bacterium]|nr:YceI family protein [Pseudomonadota bacterium]